MSYFYITSQRTKIHKSAAAHETPNALDAIIVNIKCTLTVALFCAIQILTQIQIQTQTQTQTQIQIQI